MIYEIKPSSRTMERVMGNLSLSVPCKCTKLLVNKTGEMNPLLPCDYCRVGSTDVTLLVISSVHHTYNHQLSIIQHDKEELLQLMEELKDDIDEEFMDIVLGIEKWLEIFFEEAFLDGESIRSQTDELLNKLETSEIPKSNQHRIKMLLDDIAKNRYRVEQIIQRLMDAKDKDEMSTILHMLDREGPLSDEQFKQLGELEDPDLEKITEVITDAKIGQGLNFLQRTISKLRHTLHSLLK